MISLESGTVLHKSPTPGALTSVVAMANTENERLLLIIITIAPMKRVMLRTRGHFRAL